MTFWLWFLRGSGGKAGYQKFIDWWLAVHIGVGVALALLVRASLQQCANAVLLPLAGIFIGLSFAWGGNAQALLQTKEIHNLADYHSGGFQDYVYTYQAAILAILVTLIAWGLAGLGIFDSTWPTSGRPHCYRAVGAMLFWLCSLTLRECWHVVLGAQMLLLAQRAITKRGAQPPERGSSLEDRR